MAFPIIDGISLLHWHLNRGKRSIILDLRTAGGRRDLPRSGARRRRGDRGDAARARWRGAASTYEKMQEVNPRIVFCTISGYGMTGPYKDMPSHGIAYDAWAGVARPTIDANGFPTIPSYTTIGINAGPLYAALGICAAIIRARATGRGCRFEVAQSDAAAAFNWNGIEGNKAYERPEDEVTGNDGDGKGAAPPGRRQQHDRVGALPVLPLEGRAACCSWRRSASSGRTSATASAAPSSTTQNPGSKYADHARGNVALRRELAAIFATRTTAEWIQFGLEVNTPIAPVHDTKSITRDPQFQARLPFRPLAAARHRPDAVADQAARRGAAGAVEGGGRAGLRHRRGALAGSRLRRRTHRGAAPRGRARLRGGAPRLTSALVAA